MPDKADNYCCPMREKFIVAIVKENADVPTPTSLADFVLDWTHESGKPLIGIKFCPFCGNPIDYSKETVRAPS